MANIVTSQATSRSILVVVLHYLFEIFPCFHYQTVLITDAKVTYYIGTAIRANGDLQFNISELRCIHHLSLQMLLDDFLQITSPCLLVLFGNKWRTLLSIEGVPGEWLEIEVSEEGFVLGVVWIHKLFSFQFDMADIIFLQVFLTFLSIGQSNLFVYMSHVSRMHSIVIRDQFCIT